MIGIGEEQAKLRVYIANRPDMPLYNNLQKVRLVEHGELSIIVESTGNHWRKIFNIYAKLCFELDEASNNGFAMTWQIYRDETLLQKGSKQALIFDAVNSFSDGIKSETDNCIHLITGKTHAANILADSELVEVDEDFAVNFEQRLIVTPYFDYRQLSNKKLAVLLDLIKGLDK